MKPVHQLLDKMHILRHNTVDVEVAHECMTPFESLSDVLVGAYCNSKSCLVLADILEADNVP